MRKLLVSITVTGLLLGGFAAPQSSTAQGAKAPPSAAELDQLALGGRDGDSQDEYGQEGQGEPAAAKDHNRQAALAGCGADHRKRRA